MTEEHDAAVTTLEESLNDEFEANTALAADTVLAAEVEGLAKVLAS